jgi:excisionase family DNA binding protein
VSDHGPNSSLHRQRRQFYVARRLEARASGHFLPFSSPAAASTQLIQLALKPEIRLGALYNYNQVARLTGVSVRTVKRAIESERLKADYIGSEPRIRGAAILQWLDEGGKTGRSRRDLIEEGNK